MLNFEDREETKLINRSLYILLDLSLNKSIRSVKVKDQIGELIDLLTKLYNYQKEDYLEAIKVVLSAMEKDRMGKC